MKNTRRRGKELEDAILNSTWMLLKELGYENLTMDGIAENAGTTKTVLYRRWNGKAEIIVAAAKHHLPDLKLTIPNTGSLREDFLSLFTPVTTIIEFLGADTVQGIIKDQMQKVSLIDLLGTMNTENKLSAILGQIFDNAHERREINQVKLTNATKNLPLYLILNSVLLGDLNENTLLHIIDDILLPTYRHTIIQHA